MGARNNLLIFLRDSTLVRIAAILLIGVVPYLLLSGSAKTGDQITLTYWNVFTGPDGRTMLRIVRKFNEENPDINVLMQRIEEGTYYNKLFVAGLGERAPDVFILHADMMGRAQAAGFIQPLEFMFEGDEALDREDFDASLLQPVTFDNKIYGVPLDVHCFGLYYNKELFRKAGIVDANGEAKPPRTREEFIEALQKLTIDEDGDGKPEQWAFVLTWLRNIAWTLMTQWPGEHFDENGRCIINNEGNRAALQFGRDIVGTYKAAPSPENFDAWIGFRQGRVAMAIEGVWMVADLQKQQSSLDYGAAPVPVMGERPGVFASSHVLAMAGELEGERREAAERFIKYLSDHSLDWAEGGQIPTRKSLRATERFQNMMVPNVFSQQIPDMRFHPRTPAISEFRIALDFLGEMVFRGTMTPQAALEQAEADVNEALERRRLALEAAQ